MIPGIYQSATGLDALIKVHESMAYNLANISTQGFKKEMISVIEQDPSRLTTEQSLDQAPGPIQITEHPLQLALSNSGFFAVQGPQGELFTRNGDFHLDAQGRLVNQEGYAVLGEQGEIIVGEADIAIGPDGVVSSQGQILDRIRVVADDGNFVRRGNNLWASTQPGSLPALESGQVKILQGTLEGSNVSPVEAMVDLIAVMRLYEANQKALESQDETLKQAITQVAKKV
jgi:flagellar basal-body rod protein FlgG